MPTPAAADAFNSPWTLAIRAAADQGRPRRAIALYLSSLRSAAAQHRPCPFALAAVLKSLSRLPAHAAAAASLHAHLLRLGLLAHPYPRAALAHLYSRLHPSHARRLLDETPRARGQAPPHSFLVSRNSLLAILLRSGDLPAARVLFDGMPVRDVVSWNSMVAGLAKAGHFDAAIELFNQMPERNAASWNAVMCGFIAHGHLARARELFEQMPVRSNVSWITMISGYAKAGDVNAAADLFERMENNKDLYAWNAMIACYAQNGCAREALGVFSRMLKPHIWVLPNEKTFSSVISACSQLGDLRFGLWVQSFMGSVGIELDDHLRTALVDLYTKSGRVDRAFHLFRGLRKKDVVSYSAMIVGYGMNGKFNEAIDLFKEMSDTKIDPNAVTFVGLLSAYNRGGLVEEARACFASMSEKYRISPSMEHYTIMVDLLGRSGKLDEAFELILQMPMQPHASVWGALLLACRLHNNVELGEIVASKCFELEPGESGYYIMLGSIYAQAKKWDKVKRLRKTMTERGLRKMPGSSWVQVPRMLDSVDSAGSCLDSLMHLTFLPEKIGALLKKFIIGIMFEEGIHCQACKMQRNWPLHLPVCQKMCLPLPVPATVICYKIKSHQENITGLAFSQSTNVPVSSGSGVQLPRVWSTDGWEKNKSRYIQSFSCCPE